MSLIYRHEKPLFGIVAALSSLFWLALVGGTLGIALVYAPFVFLGYCFAQSGFIAYVRGTAVELSEDQMPDLHRQFLDGCDRLGLAKVPRAFVLNGNGMMNALATRFLRQHYVILFSDIVDGLAKHPAALDFYIGHEVGHIKRGHLSWGWFVAPGMIMPLIGPAYSRAREYSCDLHGLACCDDPKDAAIAIGLLAAGEHGWQQLNINRYADQSADAKGFWMSFHELTGDYPWLTKRMKHIMAVAGGSPVRFPMRSPFAYFFAAFVPRFGGGAGGSLAGMMSVVAIIGILAAIAIPNFLRFQQRAKIAGVRDARDLIQIHGSEHITNTGYLPSSLSAMGMPDDFSNASVTNVEISESGFILHLAKELSKGAPAMLVLDPYLESGDLLWRCDSTLDDQLSEMACSDGPIQTEGSGLSDFLAAAQQGGADAASGDSATAPQTLTADGETCDGSFKETERYARISAREREELQLACNLWKLDQLQP